MTGGGRRAAGARLAATTASLVAAETILWWAGSVLPSLRLDGAGILRHLREADPLLLAVSVLRLVALGVGSGLLVTTALGLLARGCGAVGLVIRLDRWTPPGLRRLLDGAMGVGLAASIGLSALPAGAEPGGARADASTTLRRLPDAPTPSTLRRLPDAPSTPTTERSPPTDPPATLRRLADGPPEPPATGLPPPAPPAVPIPKPGAAAGRREVVVQPGDSFWRLAELSETERLGRSPTEAEVGACWQELVAVNRPRLAVPDNADLLFPGQVVIVPCP